MKTIVVSALIGVAAAAASVAAVAQAQLQTPADPMAYVEGDWYDVRSKVKVTVTNGRAVITEFATTRSFPKQYQVGTVIGHLRPGRQDGPRAYRFTGECIEPSFDGVSSRMVDCHQLQMLSAFQNSAGRPYSELSLRLLTLKKRADFSASEWQSRE